MRCATLRSAPVVMAAQDPGGRLGVWPEARADALWPTPAQPPTVIARAATRTTRVLVACGPGRIATARRWRDHLRASSRRHSISMRRRVERLPGPHRQRQREAGAPPRGRLGVEVATHRPRQPAGDRQAEARARHIARRPPAREAQEDRLLLARPEARALVGD